jgi:hypothetical protein
MHHLAPRPSRLRMALTATALAVGFTIAGAGSALAASAPAPVPTAPPALSLTTSGGTEVGQPVDVALTVTDTTEVFGYAITLTYDPAIFDYADDSASAGPAGGFDTVVPGDGTVTLVHTRLGTSPELAGDLSAALSFDTIGSGTSTITASVSLVDSTGAATVPVLPVVSEPLVITAVPVPLPVPSDTASPTASPVPSAVPSDSSTPVPAAATEPTGILALTGVAGGALLPIAAASLLAIALGVVVYRRRTASAR